MKSSISNFYGRITTSNHIYDTIGPLLTVSTIFGLIPLRINTQPNGDKSINFTYYRLFPALIQIAIFTACLSIAIGRRESIVAYFLQTSVTKVGDFLQVLSGSVGFFAIYGVSLLKWKQIVTAGGLIAECDIKLEAIGVRFDHSKMLKSIYANVILFSSITIIFVLGCYWLVKLGNANVSIPVYLTFVLPHCPTTMTVLMLMCTSKIGLACLRAVNKVLSNMQFQLIARNIRPNRRPLPFPELDFGLVNLSPLKCPQKTVEEVAEILEIFQEGWDACLNFFSFQLLVIFSIAFITMLFDCYYLIDGIFEVDPALMNTGNEVCLIFFAFQLVHFLIEIGVIVVASTDFMVESKRTATYVHRLINTVKDEGLRTSLSYLSLQLVHREVRFTAAGFFNIDRALCLSIAGTCTTYLIILLQFASYGSSNIAGDEANKNQICNLTKS